MRGPKGVEMLRESLVDKVGNLLRCSGFEAYWPNDPIKTSGLKTTIREPQQIELDIVARINSIGFLVEVTSQKEKNKHKIEKFISKYRAVKESSLSGYELTRLLSGIPQGKKENFREVREWRAIYVGTSVELIYEEMTADKFTDSKGLTIVNSDDWNYIIALKEVIGEYVRFEFVSFLGLNPNEIEDIEDIDEYFDFYKVEGRSITKEPLEADIFLYAAPPSFLLRTCRVFRFYGLPLADAKSYYQRMLNKRKLDKITKFIGRSSGRCFPTPITLVLPLEADVRQRQRKLKLAIPFKYGSLDIIDGQHRLYAYASSRIPKKIRKEGRILVNGIKFKTNDREKIKKFSARTFIDINREQMKVKTSLLYSISYDAMGDESSKSLAGKIMSLCNSNKNSPLHDLFEGRVIGRKSKLGLTRTSIVEVTNALAKVIEDVRFGNSSQSKNVSKMLGHTSLSLAADKLIELGKKLLNKYFNRVRNVLPNDWTKGTESVIFRSKYMAAFILLLQDSINKGHNFTEIENRLKKISDNVKSTSEWKNSVTDIPSDRRDQVFHKKRAAIPSVKFGTGKILKGLLWYENNNKIWPEIR